MRLQENLSNALMELLLEEQVKKDSKTYQGAFVETSVIEFVYRYWLESVLYQVGFRDICRERLYLNYVDKVGGSKSCDLSASYAGVEHWIELKVAYSNTGYTRAELISDIEKLSGLPSDKQKLYVVVFISETLDIPSKLQSIIDESNKISASTYLVSQQVPQPKSWTWDHTSIQVFTACWR